MDKGPGKQAATAPLPWMLGIAGAVVAAVLVLGNTGNRPQRVTAPAADAAGEIARAERPGPLFIPPPAGMVGLAAVNRGADNLFCNYSLGVLNGTTRTLPMVHGSLEILAGGGPGQIVPFLVQFADPGVIRPAELTTSQPCPTNPRFVIRSIDLCNFASSCAAKAVALQPVENHPSAARVVPVSFRLD